MPAEQTFHWHHIRPQPLIRDLSLRGSERWGPAQTYRERGRGVQGALDILP